MTTIEMGWALLGILVAASSLPGSLELLMLTLGGILPLPRRPRGPGSPRLAIVVPAHDEEANIARTVRSLREDAASLEGVEIVVVADNCSDDTAEVARKAGAEALVRVDADLRGKGYALDHAFETLMPRGFDAFVVIDADTVVVPDFLRSAQQAFAGGADAIQARYGVLNAHESYRTRLMSVALAAFNVLRPRGRERWGLSVGLLGNGFGLTRETLEEVPYKAASIVEDLEYHIRLVRAGRRVRFLDHAEVRADMPTGGAGTKTQRARWEGGRFLMIKEQVPKLMLGVLRGRLRLAEPLFELLLLPLAFHLTLVLLALLPPFWPTRLYAMSALGLVVLHVLAAIRVGRGGLAELLAFAGAPFYVAWKLAMTLRILKAARRDANWVRTDREKHAGG